MRGRRPEHYHVIREFGAIGNGISFAIGIAAARGSGKVVLFEGDGSLLMHIQELETIKRHGLKLLMCGAIFGRADLAAIARGFGLRGVATPSESHGRPPGPRAVSSSAA